MMSSSTIDRAAGTPEKKSRRKLSLGNVLTHVWVLLVVAVIWEIAARVAEVFYFPPLSEVLQRCWEILFLTGDGTLGLSEHIADDFLPSIGRLGAGWLIAAIVGVGLGTAIGLIPTVSDMLSPTLEYLRAVPPVALVPIFMLLFGIGVEMRITLIAFSSVWPVLLNTIGAVRGLTPEFRDTARVFGIGSTRQLFRIIIPASLPQIFAGLRVSTALAVIVMVVSEMLAATNGIGFQLIFTMGRFQLTDMWAYILFLGLLGLILNYIVEIAERIALKWQPPSVREGNN